MLSKGTYWIGDLCYILNKANGFVWDFVLQETGFLGLYEEGTLENMNPDNATGYFKFLGVEFFSSGTANGDGLFYDQSGNPYPVDAGVIGCFPTASLKNVPTNCGRVVEFERDFQCSLCDEDGDIGIGHVWIETGGA
tara:strand:+ start:342 stop:752 length:411 start_codon:yes stop_codon:yes gene_type:complete